MSGITSSAGKIGKNNTIVIKGGTFNALVAAGSSTSATGGTIGGGTYLQIDGGTFNRHVVAGNAASSGTATIKDGTHLLIKGGTFNHNVYGGSYGSTSNVVEGGVEVFIDGGRFASPDAAGYGLYAAGANGKVNGDINLTINSDKVQFDTTKGAYTISAGYHPNGSADLSGVTSSTVTLANLTGASSLATNNQLKVMGGQQTSALVMNHVDATIVAQLSQFSSMQVTGGSDLTLTQDTNATLGDVSSVTIDSGSTLSLQNGTGQNWDLSSKTLGGEGTLAKTGAGKLTIGEATGFTGTLDVKGGELHLSGASAASSLKMANGAVLSVKEGDLFSGTTGEISLSDTTLRADDGNWTLNKSASVSNVAISGNHNVSFGSEVNNDAVVTMSGEIDATKGHLILKNTAVGEDGANLSGNITFEGAVNNGNGALTIASGSTINIDEESLIRNGHFVHNGDKTAKNGFFADSEISLTTGNNYSVVKEDVNLTLDGVKSDKLGLSTDGDTLSISGFAELVQGTYFVREGEVTYAKIKEADDQVLKKIAIGNDGTGDKHQLTLDSSWDNSVTITSASDHAKVSVAENVVLDASKTEIKGEANEVHVTGAGTVLLDNADKLSQLAGDATMKLSDASTTFSTEAKMEGKLVVDGGQTLNLENKASIASFSSVELGAESKLVSKQAGNDSIKSLSGSGDLSKTGAGKLTVKDASGFTGEINASAGTLELEKVALTGTIDSKRKVSVSGGATVNLVGMEHGADVTMTELTIDGGTFGVYSGTDAVESNVVGLTLANGSMIVIGQKGGTLEANLTTEGGSTLNFTAGVALTMGCDVNMGKGTNIVINSADFAKLQDGGMVTLFNGVDNSFCMDVTDYVFCELVTASEGSGDPKPTVYFQTVGDKAVLSTTRVPEPTTGTLSLLALAGLCARRRRKH
ncbi:MAG: hypothetical protein Q4F30_01830 [Akkermansia sp.]|nr:hypothetical protein [Akkermansia sp.]